jgi:type IV secretory pathway VirB3-like protein
MLHCCRPLMLGGAPHALCGIVGMTDVGLTVAYDGCWIVAADAWGCP